jgi:diaminopimelate decarboxylase
LGDGNEGANVHHFWYKENKLYCEDVPVSEIARKVGTPFYLYSQATLERHFKTFDQAFAVVPHLTCFAVKSNSNLAILSLFRRLGAGFDIVSGGELLRSLKAGGDPQKIVYSGVGKSEAEIDLCLQHDILQFNVESAAELKMLEARAQALNKKARISLRVNPNVDPKTHPYIATGLRQHKFGVAIEEAPELYQKAARFAHLKITGIGFHIGSQITRVEPFVDALLRLKELVASLRASGIKILYLDLGGGLGITYNDEAPPHPDDYSRAVLEIVQDMDCTVLLEPGRVIVGNAGILVTRVILTKHNNGKNFVIVDAAMNDLIRPSLYGSYHAIQPETLSRRGRWTADVVGPICESGDFLARDRDMPIVKAKDLLAVMTAGAYGFALSSNYNSRMRVPEVLVCGKRFKIIRKRETFKDLMRGECLNPL